MTEHEELAPRFKAAILNWMKTRNPFWALLGLELLEIRKGWATLRIPIDEKLTNAIGLVHGGAIFSVADSAVGTALVGMINRNENISTLEMKINYMKPAKGGELIAEAKIIHKGNQTAVGDVEVRDEEQNLIAKGLATYAIFKRDREKGLQSEDWVTRTE
ncbi:MAG: PaaI family thioesterase [Desulfobacterales bacterium]|nr:MAG: PaaI family thioesterase [Desulfobacterales bacterium]